MEDSKSFARKGVGVRLSPLVLGFQKKVGKMEEKIQELKQKMEVFRPYVYMDWEAWRSYHEAVIELAIALEEEVAQ